MIEYFNPTGINTFQNPLQTDGQLIHAVNMYSPGLGVMQKRPGYNSFLGTPDNAQVNTLYSFPDQNGTTLTLIRASGSIIYSSQQGTGAWTITGNGTITNGNHIGGVIVNNVFLLGDGAGSTRHVSGASTPVSFTNTTLAPIGQYFAQYQGRAYTTSGTNSVLSFSVANDITNWQTGGTSDSSSLTIPEEGAAGPMFVAGDRLIVTKTRGKMYNWDATSLVDMATKYGPTMPWSIGNIDDQWLYTNQYGVFTFDGANRQLISNPMQRQFYNRQATGMGTAQIGALSSACGAAFIWDYFVTLGTITDDFTGRQISNAILKYDYQKNAFLNWQFNDTPTAMLAYTDANNQKQLIFGNNAGQCFQLSQTATSDNGNAISSEMVFLFTYAAQQSTFSPTSASVVSGSSPEKKWNWLRLFLNPGCEIDVQYAFSNTLTYQHLKWSEAVNTAQRTGDFWNFSDGVMEMRFPNDPNNVPRSRFLFLRLYERSDNSLWQFLGSQIDAEIQIIK
jgi:hypothetical protein